MPTKKRWTFLFWANNSVCYQSCPFLLGRSAGRFDPTRLWFVRVLDLTGYVLVIMYRVSRIMYHVLYIMFYVSYFMYRPLYIIYHVSCIPGQALYKKSSLIQTVVITLVSS